ncbi:hypothetical protein BT63DRAFT_421530 [Microthyrium microscopicum]|uniref:Uncharacterized protein n=1 Tax=Microthyrium microscopicum TaxID=703497 RepID=A0A6A6UM72_9PEZI|nr:hypothetical protein BT63DRAFT_421530 [Microthyrium microscopicum]
MTAPALHIFPPVSDVERRRQEMDELIKKSLEVRPTRQFARERTAPVARRGPSRTRTAPVPPMEQKPVEIQEQRQEVETFTAPKPAPVASLPLPPRSTSLEKNNQLPRIETVPQLPQEPIPQPQAWRQSEQHSTPPRNSVHPQQPRESTYSVPRQTWTSVQPPEFNPEVIKTDPLPAPPIDAEELKRSISRTPARPRPRRSSSTKGYGRMSSSTTRTSGGYSAASSHASSTFSTLLQTIDSPVTNPSIYGSIAGSRPGSKFDDSRTRSYVQQQRLQSYTPPPPPPRRPSADIEENPLPLPPPPPPRSASRASVRSNQTIPTPPSAISSRASHIQQDPFADRYSRGRRPSTDSATLHESPVLSRSNTVNEIHSPESFYAPEKALPSNVMEKSIQSMFPTYDHSVPLQQQSYHPQRVAPVPPFARIKHDHAVSSSSASSSTSTASSPRLGEISTMGQLGNLWTAANGQITAPLSGPFNLKMFKQASKAKRQSKITFGPSEEEVFYSLAQAHPSADEDDEPSEALIFRHHASETQDEPLPKDDLLPISHMLISKPPAPSATKASRHSPEMPSAEPATQITTVTPVLATLHALEHASKSAQAHALSVTDPKAESPAAARLAERAVRAATERESCTLTWLRSCARTGKYELNHPSLGVFTVAIEGDVKAALASISSNTKSRKHASISLMNPFAHLAANGSPPLNAMSPTAYSFNNAAAPANKKSGLLAKLDFTEEILHIDGPGIQALGNLYLLDVCVSTILAVAIAESQRPADPGLFFAAPPPSLMLAKVRKGFFSNNSNNSSSNSVSEAEKKKAAMSTVSLVKLVRGNAKGGNKKAIDWTRANAIMGIEHLTDMDDLPRITRGILSVLGAGFKTALWLLEFGVRISAKMVIGLSKFAERG